MKIEAEKVITNEEVKDILEARAKTTELKYEQKNSLDIIKRFSISKSEKLKKLVEELKQIPRLRERQIVEIANFLPEDKDDLRVILHKEYNSFTEEEINKILESVKRV